MRLSDILSQYSDEALDRLASDKVDEVANLRLPRSVLIDEIAIALTSLSYVAGALAPTRPPTYAFLSLLLAEPEHARAIDGFRDSVMAETDRLTSQARDGAGFTEGKNYELYLRILHAAWENDGAIDRSETLLLAALRKELGVWTREHLLLEHHPLVCQLWASARSFDDARNHLLATGLVLTTENRYVVADEVCRQLRRAWDIDLEDSSYTRLLDALTGAQLRNALELARLPVSGSKEERVARVIVAMVPPPVILDALNIAEIRDLCRSLGLNVSGHKSDLIASVVEHYDTGKDLEPAVEKVDDDSPRQPEAPEARELEQEPFARLLDMFSADQLYDVLAAVGLRRSGSKAERVERLVKSNWSEHSLLSHTRRSDLTEAARHVGVRISGVKADVIQRLVAWAKTGAALTVAESTEAEAASILQPESPVPVQSPPVPGSTREPTGLAPQVKAPPLPPTFAEVSSSYPDLGRDEHVILAMAKEARSLSERDIERIVHHHQLGWFLTKAHMADLLARLERSGRNPIRVRSTGGLNIYEWHGGAPRSDERLDREAARDLVDALRNGVVPDNHLDRLAVGQDAQRAHLLELLDHVRTGKSVFKFIRAPYGGGKTFLCSWLRDQAFARDFAVSTVRIGPDQPLSDLPVFFAGVVNGLRTPEKREASALADVLESWLLTIHRRTAQLEGLSPFDPREQPALARIVEQRIEGELERIAQHDPGFAPALKAFYRARVGGDQDTAATALAWLRGSSSVSSDGLRAIGVRGQLEPEQVFPRLTALLEVIGAARLNGLLLLVDELELVRRFPHARQREQAYETLRQLMDEAGENDLPRCLLLFTGTDALFEDPRFGLPSYEALANRISAPEGPTGVHSMRQPVIRLDGLNRDRLRAVLTRVREIHSAAYGWGAQERVPDAILEQLIDRWTSFGSGSVDRLPRPVLREIVHILDLCEENPTVQPEDCLRRAPAPDPSAVLAILEN